MRAYFARRLLGGVMAATLLLAACAPKATPIPPTITPAPSEDPRTPVIIDTDISLDGVMAILYILQRPELAVKAITVAGTGAAHCGPGTAHVAGLVALAEAGEIPVACGRETPLAGSNTMPFAIREMADGDMGIRWPETGSAPGGSAVQLIHDAILASPKPVVVITDGPLTNLGEALEAAPQLAQNIQMIYTMGGAIDVPGNIEGVALSAPNKTAEFNVFVDPHAASVVINSGAPITLVPLDASNQVPLDRVFYKLLEANKTTPEAAAVYDALTATEAYRMSGMYVWDPLVYAIAADESLATFASKKVSVVEEKGAEIGRVKVMDGGKEVRVAMTADYQRFVETYLAALNGQQQLALDWEAAKALPPNSIVVTVSDGKCTLETSGALKAGEVLIQLANMSPDRSALVAACTYDEGKTIEDARALEGVTPASWIHVLGAIDAVSASSSEFAIEAASGPIYIACFDGTPSINPEKRIGILGPIEIAP